MPTCYVRVAVNLPGVSALFDYHLPPELEGRVTPGCLVVVPFGRQTAQGIVWQTVGSPEVAETRAVIDLLDPLPVLTPAQRALADWMARETLASPAACFGLMLPPGLGKQADTLYTPNLPVLPETGLSPLQEQLARLLRKRGPLRGRQIDPALPNVTWRPTAQAMIRKGWLVGQSILPPPSIAPRQVRTVRLSVSPEEMRARLEEVGRAGSPARARRAALLEFLAREAVEVETAWAYAAAPGANASDLARLEELGLVALGESEAWRDPLENVEIDPALPLPLTPAQSAALDALERAIREAADGKAPRPCLLHGVTGSGKTEVYLRAAAETIRLGRQVLVLVPEISLTPQAVRRYAGRFPGQVGLVHSRLSDGERYDTWRRARAGQLRLVIGPRSALFTPLPDLGLIVVDECHDDSYYQDELPPAYSAVNSALALAHFTGAAALLGSATPDVALMQRAQTRRWTILRLPERAPVGGAQAAPPLPAVQIVDMRRELQAGNRSMFSRALLEALEQTLQAGQQAILFLNRRGTNTFIFCRECGYTLHCPRCDVPLVYHNDPPGLHCHTCNYRRQMPARCPSCGAAAIRQFGMGTERVENEAQARFPTARVLRWDAETARKKGAPDLLLAHFAAHRADILVGTQMVAKGLDLPLVTLVGVVLADVGLQLPDYRAGERGFQLLTQVAGRAGRSPLGGRAIFQTYLPEHYAIQAAARQDYDAFYRRELEYRRKLGYPPFLRLARLELRGLDSREVEAESVELAGRLRERIEAGGHRQAELIGPAPCFFTRRGGLYRWQIILRALDPAAILRGLPAGDWRIEIDPPGLL